MLGKLIMKQAQGLPMGSASASALTRMVLVYLDVIWHSAGLGRAPCCWSPSSLTAHPRTFCKLAMIKGFVIVLLKVRCVDDYLAMWECVEGGVPINILLYPMEGDYYAAIAYWLLAYQTGGSFMSISKDWP